MRITLFDGTIINSDSDDVNDLVGSTLTDEEGQILKRGRYITADRILLKVGSRGKCTHQEYDSAAALLI